ncbi:hypothetical protein MTR67_039119 [Solanum verrucosum]|uniref:Uncharacterized protein n=1 Tax=Solanum verrucosum TaxID=315347 RepID=A0AAF0UI39_SOLVR|nr:hypothetical protein MTR67_039119 [Solanum verrucosum]
MYVDGSLRFQDLMDFPFKSNASFILLHNHTKGIGVGYKKMYIQIQTLPLYISQQDHVESLSHTPHRSALLNENHKKSNFHYMLPRLQKQLLTPLIFELDQHQVDVM